MKKVGITQRLVLDEKTGEFRTALDVNWYNLFLSNELLPIPIPLISDYSEFFGEVGLQGLIFSGGNNLSVFDRDELSKKRDFHEKLILQECIKRKLPVLGVCRGMQFISSEFGCRLQKIENHVRVNHGVNQVDHSFDFLKGIDHVNSFHDYGVIECSEIIQPLAYAEDGTIEAIAHKNLPIVGVMWHPERKMPEGNTKRNFIKDYFN